MLKNYLKIQFFSERIAECLSELLEVRNTSSLAWPGGNLISQAISVRQMRWGEGAVGILCTTGLREGMDEAKRNLCDVTGHAPKQA